MENQYTKDSEIVQKTKRNPKNKKINKKRKKSQNRIIKRRSKWSIKQTLSYLQFIREWKQTLEKQNKKQKQKVYNRMQQSIQTRDSRKCKSHHQKMIIRYKSIQGILNFYEQRIKKWLQELRAKQAYEHGIENIISLPQDGQQSMYYMMTYSVNPNYSFFFDESDYGEGL